MVARCVYCVDEIIFVTFSFLHIFLLYFFYTQTELAERDELIVGLSSCLESLFFSPNSDSIAIERAKLSAACSPFISAIEAKHAANSISDTQVNELSSSVSSASSSIFPSSSSSAHEKVASSTALPSGTQTSENHNLDEANSSNSTVAILENNSSTTQLFSSEESISDAQTELIEHQEATSNYKSTEGAEVSVRGSETSSHEQIDSDDWKEEPP